MKKITLLLSALLFASFNMWADETVLCDVETVKSNYTVGAGGTFDVIENPLKNSINNTDSVIQFGRSSNTYWYANIVIPVTPFETVTGENYIDIAVKYSAQPDFVIRLNGSNSYQFRPTEFYTNLDGWQILRFDISSVGNGLSVNSLTIYGDAGFQNNPAGYVLNNTDAFGYIDQIKYINSEVAIPESIDKELCNFESVETASTSHGATATRILNPQSDSNNNSDSCLRVGRTSTNWYELIDVAIDNFLVPSSEKCYVHIMVKSSVALDISLRPNTEAYDIRALNPYSGNDEWQDLVFDLGAHKDPGYVMSNIRLLTDVQKVLNNTNTLAYFDEIIVNEDPNSRFSPTTLSTTVSTFEETGYDWTASSGATITKVENTDNSGASINATDSCIKLGDLRSTYYPLIDLGVDLTVPLSDCYLHVFAKSNVTSNFTLRTMPDNATDIIPEDSLVGNMEWQDLVFNIGAIRNGGYKINKLRFMLDYGEENNNLNNTDSVLYIDEIIIDSSATPRTSTATKLDEATSSDIVLFPNPVENTLYISDKAVKQVSLYNVSGQKVMDSRVVAASIELSNLEQGIYFVQCKDEKGLTISQQSIVKK